LSTLELNIRDPKLYAKQHQFLALDRTGEDVHCSHFVGGRGCAKTTSGVILAFLAAYIWDPGIPGLVTEPTYRHLHDVFLREWEKIVPAALWKLNTSLMRLELLNGGTIDLRSRNVDNPTKEISKGPNYGWCVEDESSYKFNLRSYNDVHAAIRHPDAKRKFHVTLTTPKLNDYARLIRTPGHVVVQATSFDNPYLPANFARDLEASMGKLYARQEIYGEFIAQQGRIWSDFSEDRWPRGNMVDLEYDRAKPWELWCDLGIMSSWLAIQKSNEGGYQRFTVVAEWQPNNEGAAQTIQRIVQNMGRPPSRVIVGADVGTRSVASAERPIYYFRQAWGDSTQVQPVTGDLADKGLQHMQASAAILTSDGKRRFCVSTRIKSHDEDNGRTILETMRTDQWGDNPRIGEYMPKTKGRSDLPNTEDTRDAFLYGVIVNFPPQMGRTLYQVAG
jgi:hypothetical protein